MLQISVETYTEVPKNIWPVVFVRKEMLIALCMQDTTKK